MEYHSNIALAFYQNLKTASQAFKKLRMQGIKHSVLIHRDHAGKISVKGNGLSLPFFCRIEPSLINQFKKLVISDEILIIALVEAKEVSNALAVLRHVETGHPTSVLLWAGKYEPSEQIEFFIEPLTLEALTEHAKKTALSLGSVGIRKTGEIHLLKNLRQCEKTLNEIRSIVAEAEFVEQTITLAAEWLLDNTYVIQGNIEEVLRNLPPKYYHELPKVLEGPGKGLPRVYIVAKDIVQCTANRLNRENIIAYLESFQSVCHLTIGELWVLPLMLRLRLIECLNLLSLDIDRRLKESEHAFFWGHRLLTVSRRESNRLNEFLNELKDAEQDPSPHFAEELIDHLYDEDKIIPLVRVWLESYLKKDLTQTIKEEQLQKSVEQVSLSNAIVSLINLSQLSWREIFETVCPIDKILSKDPSHIYDKMDFNTRDSYRHAIEELAKRSKYTEGEIASRTLQMAEHGKNEVTSHIGYYLVDQGRNDLELAIDYRPEWSQYIRQKMTAHPVFVYLGCILCLTLVILMLVALFLYHSHTNWLPAVLLITLFILPASEISVQLVTMLITKILQPMVLPKLSFEEQGIPEELKTLVVMPALLTTEADINENINQLLIHYLANSSKALCFGIFYDYTDAPQASMPSDQILLDVAIQGFQALQEKYGKGKFFLFFRERSWSKSENAWIGRERKRGKLESLNRFLVEHFCPELILKVGEKEALHGIRYVITLDADTALPKDSAKQLIETIAHPLNAPKLDEKGKVYRGYTIIQPRVGTDITRARNTLFSKIFSDAHSINPYTQAVSDIYQDLISEGNYHGKGIYDVQTFHRILNRFFPQEHILSHDLIEGVHVRVGFASDIVLSDIFPQDYSAWSKRQHRWIRGDWQVADWIFSKVPSYEDEKLTNPLSFINRWKVFDNLRRSLLPIFSLLLLITAFFSAYHPIFWSSLILLAYLMPTLSMALFNLSSVRGFVLTWKDLLYQGLRAIINIAMLPQQAYLSMDAILRVLYRKNISRKKLLEWETFYPTSSFAGHQRFIHKLGFCSLFSLVVLAGVLMINPSALTASAVYLLLWFLSPFLINFLDKTRIIVPSEELKEEELLFLRQVARRTWRYFDDFVGPQTNWLPPDNYQSALTIEVAMRTSPTNIGLWMLAVVAAHDFKYVTLDDAIDRLAATFHTFKKLEMYEGHFLNWYDIQSLKPLYPRYVSTVDSGNLLASFWTLEQAIFQLVNHDLLPLTILNGLKDGLNIVSDGLAKDQYQNLKVLFSKYPKDTGELIDFFQKGLDSLGSFIKENHLNEAQQYWFKHLEEELIGWQNLSKRYYGWIEILKELKPEELAEIGPQAEEWRTYIFMEPVSLKMLASTKMPKTLETFLEALKEKGKESPKCKRLHKRLEESVHNAQWLAGEKMAIVNEIIMDINSLCDGLNMRFLYNEDRKLFSIGYHVDDCRLDNSYYDLLASEARISSFVAIAKDDVPLEHWWALGRPYGYLYGRHVLMSWGGTMFEYLMPLLFKNVYPDSLITKACQDAVACQMTYGERRGIPWGISEAAFSAIDAHKIYQYRSFGVPGLGFKRGLEEDLVVSPYSTALALAINPKAAIKNFKVLEKQEYKLLGEYGYYESIDFTRQRAPHGERGVIVYAFMAHHQGMSLLAVDNVLNNNVFRKRFHANPRICGMESLLCERAPMFPPVSKGSRKSIPISRLTPFPSLPIMGMVETPQSGTPKVNLLSNGQYSVMITNSGGSSSTWRDLDITRWRADVTSDNWGSFCYIKDMHSGDYWSAGYHPTCRRSKKYIVSFKADRTEIRRLDYQIETNMEIIVSPEDDAEVRLLTLANLSRQKRVIELTSYSELALATHAADAAHPCFNKLFIETEAIPEIGGLIAYRRLRSSDEKPVVAGHIVIGQNPSTLAFEYETDRAKFIGCGRTLNAPAAMDGHLSNTQGYVLDPIFSLRYSLTLNPGQRIQVSFVTVISENKEKTIALLKKYADMSSSQRAIEMAWVHAQLELRRLHIHQEEVQLFQKLASRVLYPHAQLRPSAERLIRNKRGQSHLWAYGISGDLPIVVASIADTHEIDFVKQLIIAHIFWRMRGLKTDLVILNEESTGYENPLSEQLQRLMQAFSTQTEIGKSGGVYLLNSDQIPEEDLILILAVARVNLIAARGSLRQQLVTPVEAGSNQPRLLPDSKAKEFPSKPLPFVALEFFNSIGGFSPDGREYMIFLDSVSQTPAPWINVIANASFGTIVSESGLGTTWYGNSQTNRLTPWSNDPVLNPITDIVYIRDEKLGTFWTPTPSPIRELDPYRIRHGQGYTRFEHNSHGIEQDLTVFVPNDDNGGLPVRVQRLKLKNSSNEKRNLSVFAYTEWVLGIDREKTQMHIITEWDPESQSLFAFNRYNPDYGNYLAFACSIPLPSSYTCNRSEFLGRNTQPSNPTALKRKNLGGNVGAAFDSCAALQVEIVLNPNEEKEVVFLIGYAQDAESARKLIALCREPRWAEEAHLETIRWWDRCLGTLYVETPDKLTNFAFNRWLLYQNLSCRFWGRSAFYQSSGAFGFRDQLQDAMALLYSAPYLARKQILLAASRQFLEGDVQHWWHPPNNGGVRTRISDDLLWLPFVTAQYVRVTHDFSILQEEVPFIKGELLKEDQHEAYFVPEVTEETASLMEHCRRALKKGLTEGPHGLPLMGGGDWNDGMNRVGIQGRGESVWLAWFLVHVMNDFADLMAWNGQSGSEDGFRAQAKRLAKVIEEAGWDGEWYRRAYFDDGTPLGSKQNQEAMIDAIAQAWSVISKAGSPERVEKALKAVEEYLIKENEKLVLLLTPPFDKTTLDPGYIKGYPPGVRENGGQYTHGCLWVPLAFAMLGLGDKAMHLIQLMHPISHSSTKEEAFHFKVEPYALAADIYSLPGQVGRGGWTWYTGSAGWMYRILLEEIFGFKLRGNNLYLQPVLPKAWKKISLYYQYQTSRYEITMENDPEIQLGKASIELDGVMVKEEIILLDDGKVHQIRIKAKQ